MRLGLMQTVDGIKEGNMANGYTGNILRVNLSTQTISTINTRQYESWVGGHGMCSAIFWTCSKDKTISGP